MDILAELWVQAQKAGPFASLILLTAVWALNAERKQERLRTDEERRRYDELVARFVELAGDTSATLKDWRDVLFKVQGKRDE